MTENKTKVKEVRDFAEDVSTIERHYNRAKENKHTIIEYTERQGYVKLVYVQKTKFDSIFIYDLLATNGKIENACSTKEEPSFCPVWQEDVKFITTEEARAIKELI